MSKFTFTAIYLVHSFLIHANNWPPPLFSIGLFANEIMDVCCEIVKECQSGKKKFTKETKVSGKKMLSGTTVEDEGLCVEKKNQ